MNNVPEHPTASIINHRPPCTNLNVTGSPCTTLCGFLELNVTCERQGYCGCDLKSMLPVTLVSSSHITNSHTQMTYIITDKTLLPSNTISSLHFNLSILRYIFMFICYTACLSTSWPIQIMSTTSGTSTAVSLNDQFDLLLCC